ncbi:mitochondrial outer membrane protein-like protein [Macroventuria anomochaeta]|uniref:Mitochondrial outer membrane protein-like protein n=1 Tax=Macroventuria anomochaeta TaxID=301207 RepID=A0ACB6SI01_9PLEO|nr:mitochondrial outer membrane protein-like protein [Macroventuria anomochaeta]KAF2633664.1 mitochondrial outer membrane protein-like protein [Macroventuria anomochaeta]
MASPIEDDVFARLKNKTDSAEVKRQQDELNTRLFAQHQKSQERLAELVEDNTSLPVTISSVRVLHANRTRRGFLEKVVNPLLSASRDESYTLEEALKEVGNATDKLNRFGIFKSPISVFLDRPDPTNAACSPTDVDVYISAHERGNYTIKTGTEAGASEADAYVNAELRNLFGGAETLNAHGSLGTRTRSAYSLAFDTPVLANPDCKWQVNGFASSVLKSWAGHEEVQKGGTTKLLWRSKTGHEHTFGYSGIWRQVTSLAENASPTVRADAGDSFKSTVTHTWTNDKRDYPLLPSSGYLLKTVSELAGFSVLGGDVSHFKTEAESQIALPFGNTGITLTAGLRGGLLYPLARAGSANPPASRINDRFQLGGPNSVRGFRLGGLGPHDGPDAVGGDVFAAGGASLLLPVPRVGKETPLRLQAFINGGRLLALKGARSEDGSFAGDARESLKKTLRDLKEGLPSAAAGVGLVYAHPIARFEINFSLPLVMRKEEQARKGLSFGVGIEFL